MAKTNIYKKLLYINLSTLRENGYCISEMNLIRLYIGYTENTAFVYFPESYKGDIEPTSFFDNCKEVKDGDKYFAFIISNILIKCGMDIDGDTIDILQFINARNIIMNKYPRWKFKLKSFKDKIFKKK